MLLSIAQPVAAHEGDEGTESFLYVRQAIALIVNTPDAHEVIADKIKDAIEAPDTHGVDVSLVEQAQAALEAEDIQWSTIAAGAVDRGATSSRIRGPGPGR